MENYRHLNHGIDRNTLLRWSQRSDRRGWLQFGLHALTLGATGTLLWASRGWAVAPALVLHGVVLDCLFCGLHETSHRTAFASRRANEAVGWLCGALLVLPPQYFRAFHFSHHRFTQDPARDPELLHSPPASLASYLWRVSGIPYWTDRLSVTLRHALTGRVTESFVPAAEVKPIVREARLLWGVYLEIAVLSLAFGSGAALTYWVLPAVVGQPFLRLFLMAEHAACAFNGDAFVNARTTRTHRLVRCLTWQMSFHAEHHAFPSIPFHALADLHRRLGDRIALQDGYLRLHGSLVRRFLVVPNPRKRESHGG